MRVLAVDSTTARESVAVAVDGELVGEVRLRPGDVHSRRLAPAIAFLLEALGIAPAEVEGYAVTVGPGSFTGIRVGLATVQGLALAARRPVLGVSALDVLAARVRGCAPTLAAVMEAGRGQVYARLYDGEARPAGQPEALAPEELLARVPEGAAVTGDAAFGLRSLLAARRVVFPERSLYLAGTLARLAGPRLADGEGQPPATLRPLYLRAAHIRGRSLPA